jgi:hypothetical protein
MRPDSCKRILTASAAVLLILAVVGCSVTATHGRYQPESDPAYFLYTSIKMNVTPPVVFAAPPTYASPEVLPAPSNFWMLGADESERLEIRQIGLTVSLQHRSPPFLA